MHKKILHGLDGSDGSFKALTVAVDLAKHYGAELHTISVEEIPHYPGTIGEVVEEKRIANGKFGIAVEKACEMAKKAGFEVYESGVEVKFVPNQEDLKKCFDFGQQIAQKIKA